MSKHDDDERVRLKALEPRALWAAELSPGSLQALSDSRMDRRHDDLNQLLDD